MLSNSAKISAAIHGGVKTWAIIKRKERGIVPDIYGSYFTYGTGSSETYGLVISATTSGRFVDVSGEIKGSTIFNRKAKKNYLITDDYSKSPLSFDVDFEPLLNGFSTGTIIAAFI